MKLWRKTAKKTRRRVEGVRSSIFETLEDRRLLAILPLLQDGVTRDGNGDGTFEQVLTSGSSLQISQFSGTEASRAIAEYDTSAIPAGATISSAHLTFRNVALTSGNESRVNVVAYAGDGTIDIADAATPGSIVATYDSVDLGLGEHTIHLDIAPLQNLVGQSNITLRLQAFDDTVNTAISADESISYDGPQLDINFLPPAEEIQLAVTLGTISEAAGAAATTATISRTDDDLSVPLTANLHSSDTSELTVPAQVTIPSGLQSATFPVSAVDDDLLDGTQTVTITATEVLATGVGLDGEYSQTSTQLLARSSDSYPDIVLLPDQSAIAVGDAETSSEHVWQLTKILPNGGIDTSFGSGGVVQTDFGPFTSIAGAGLPHGVALQADGKIIVGGEARGGTNVYEDVALARYLPDGSLDTTFASAGKLRLEFTQGHSSVYDVAVQPNGKILVAGVAEGDFLLARFDNNGTPDPSFGNGGMRQIDSSIMGYGIGSDMELLPDGRFLVTSYLSPVTDFVVSRFNADGSFDTTFDGDGRQQISFTQASAIPTSLGLQDDGRVVVAGYAFDSTTSSPRQEMAATRLNIDGSIDSSFGNNGRFTYDFANLRDEANDVVVRGDGSIVLVGTLSDPLGTTNSGYAMGLVGLTADGNLDTSFATNGAYFGPPLPSIFEEIRAGVLDDQDRLVAIVGYYDDIRVTRFNLDDMGRTANVSVSVTDDEVVGSPLTVTINRDYVFEYRGENVATATISRVGTSGPLTVSLTSSDTSEISVQSSARIPDGQSSVVVPLDAVEDTLLDGTQTVEITASAPGYADGSDSIDVRDFENLTFSIDKDSIAIGGETATATVTRLNTDIADPLTVNVQYDHASDLIVPSQVEIPAGQPSVTFPITSTDNGIVEGNRSIQFVVHEPRYFNVAETFEVREDGVISVASTADGHATDWQPFGSFDSVDTPNYSIETRVNSQLERRGIFEFDLAAIGGNLDAASLTLRTSGLATSQGVGPKIEVFGYMGDGSLSPSDADVGQKIGELQFPGDGTGIRRFGIPLNLSFMQDAVNSHQFVGLSTRIVSGSSVSFVSSRNTFNHESNHPHLQFAFTPNPPFEARDDTATTNEDTSVAINALQNDSGNGLFVASITDPANGMANINPDGTITYTPDANFHGADSFVYTAKDETGAADTATVNISVNAINDRPTAVPEAVTISEDNSATIDLLANDFDVDGDELSLDIVTQPQIGTVTVNANDTVTYTPPANYHGTQTFVYTNTDGELGSNRVFVTVTVTAKNDAPNASDDSTTTAEDSAVTIPVLGNDSDIDGDSLTVTATTNPSNGAVTMNPDGTIIYTPNANFHGADSFEYTISDGNGGVDTATVNVDVTPVNDAPVAVNDAATTSEDTAVTVSVLGNDTDIDGDSLTITAATNPSSGSATVNPDGTITYIPNANFHGADSFEYTISDGNGGVDTATVNVEVTPVNDAPVAVHDTATTPEDTAVTVPVLDNDSDIDGDSLTVTAATNPSNGAVTVNQDGTITYTPDANFHGADGFEYTVSDGNGGVDTATVNVEVTPVNDVPVAVHDAATTLEDTAVTIPVLGNDSDIDGDSLTATAATNPSNGAVTMNPDGTITYTPDANFHGADGFEYTVSDGNGGVDTATVNISVGPVNDAPVAVDAVFTLLETAPNGTEIGTLIGSDVDGDDLTFAISGIDAAAFAVAAQTGVLSVADSTLLDFETKSQFDFVVEVSDGNGGQAAADVRINLTDVSEVMIDVLPDDPTNSINLRKKHIEVAILGSATFDPTSMLDLNSIRLGVSGSDVGAGIVSHRKHGPKTELRDVNGDGVLDLVVKFETKDTGIKKGDTSVNLVASLLPEYGGDSISIDEPVTITNGNKRGGKRKRT